MRGCRTALAGLAALAALCVAGPAEASGRSPERAPRGEFAAAVPYRSPALAEAARWLGSGNMTGYAEAWCRDFVNFVLTRTGHALADTSHAAITALRLGPRVAEPRPGDLAVMAHHVGFVEGIEPDGSVRLISGNCGHRVARSLAPRRTIVAFVEPR